MPDIIQLLPDNIANQIAAGEVIQRPASAVKELMENAVDAGATQITLIINDAGKALVQVIDNGSGMSETDARMSFERHATSKIKQIEDLFKIKTMGFRGEALASIAAVAEVELKTKRAEDKFGVLIEISNSKVIRQEPVAHPQGTSIAMKNVFFNVPARRNFLKSNAVELRHIIDEFTRIALSFPELSFSFINNGQQLYSLTPGTLKQRIVQIMGANYNARLVSVQEKTDYMQIYGFIGKPDTARKTRGEQYLFVNNRFIKSAYLNHAVGSAYSEMIPKDAFPLFVLFIDLDPSQVDINVHPTKQEIKFEDERLIYAFLQSAIKHALAQFSISPTLDFQLDPEIQKLDAVSKPFTEEKKASTAGTSLYQGFTQKNQAHKIESKSDLKNWKDLYAIAEKKLPESQLDNGINETKKVIDEENFGQQKLISVTESLELQNDKQWLQLMNTYIVIPTNRGFIVVHQQSAHERILYERFNAALNERPIATQRNLFPTTLELPQADAALLQDLMNDLNKLGYMIEPFGKNMFIVQGVPADIESGNEKIAIENFLEQYKHYSNELKFSAREKLLRSMAWQQSIKPGKNLSQQEMKTLVEELFQSEIPNTTPNGRATYFEFKRDYLDKMFGK